MASEQSKSKKKSKSFNVIKGKIENNAFDSTELLGNKIPPHSLEAEIAVLGSMLLDKSAIAKVLEIIDKDDEDSFYSESHKIIFSVIAEMFRKGMNVDLLTLSEEINKRGLLEQIGGSFYLAEINIKVPTAANVEQYARIIQEKYLKRLLIQTSGQILADAYDDTNDALEEIDDAENKIFQIAQKRFHKGYKPIKPLAHETFDLISNLFNRKTKGITGVNSGFEDLDKLTGGFQKSDLIIIAGRPSMGKTAFGLSIARNAAMKYNFPVAIFSIEMSAPQLVMRLIAGESEVNGNKIRTGNISQKELNIIVKTMGKIAEAPMVIDDSASLTIMELRAKARRLIAEFEVKMIMIDYLQLMRSPKSESREREISFISQNLKQLAKELNIPILALAQLNRVVESRKDKRPMLSDLRESGSIEQDADVVMLIHRPEFYNIEKMDDGTDSKGLAEIIISKQRNGPTGSVRLSYKKDYAKFDNLAYEYQTPPDEMINANQEDYVDPNDSDEDSPF